MITLIGNCNLSIKCNRLLKYVDAISPTGSGVVGPNRVTNIFVMLPVESNAFRFWLTR